MTKEVTRLISTIMIFLPLTIGGASSSLCGTCVGLSDNFINWMTPKLLEMSQWRSIPLGARQSHVEEFLEIGCQFARTFNDEIIRTECLNALDQRWDDLEDALVSWSLSWDSDDDKSRLQLIDSLCGHVFSVSCEIDEKENTDDDASYHSQYPPHPQFPSVPTEGIVFPIVTASLTNLMTGTEGFEPTSDMDILMYYFMPDGGCYGTATHDKAPPRNPEHASECQTEPWHGKDSVRLSHKHDEVM